MKKRDDLPVLRTIYFYLTEGCNLRCRHCWLAPRYDDKGRGRTLPVDLFQRAVREAKPLGLQSVKLTGGEPLLHPRFPRLLEILRQEDVGLAVETNGVLCTREIAEDLARTHHPHVSVSIDGADAETHEWMRGVAGCFEQSKEAVRHLVAAGIETEIIMSLTRRNADQIEDVVHMAEALGASSVKFNIIQPTARGEALIREGESLPVEELIRFVQYTEEVMAGRTDLDLYFDYPNAFRPMSRIARQGCSECEILNIVGVLSDGSYALCGIGHQIGELVFGTVGQDGLDTLWAETPVLKALRAGLPRRLEGVCSRCILRKSCRGRCIAQNYYSGRSLWAPFWFCHEAYQKGLFPESRLCDILE